jgi:hypothetical protein
MRLEFYNLNSWLFGELWLGKTYLFKIKNVKPIRRSLHDSRRLRIAHHCRNEQLRTSRRYGYITPFTPVIPTVRMHHRLTSLTRDV